MKLNEIMTGGKVMEVWFLNVWVEETNLCHWVHEDCIFRQDWNLHKKNCNVQ